MAKNDPCCNINVVPLIMPCNYFLVAAKNPMQKPHKNPTKIWWDKNFYIFLNIHTNKKPKT